MTAFPLVHTKWSNEHSMAVVFGVALLYMLPVWVQSPAEIVSFAAVLILALVLDVLFNFIRYRRPVCAVSAAVTAAVFMALTPGVPLWGRLLGVAFGLIAGKHLWGGTGKNVFNPAVLGLLLVGIFFPVTLPAFRFSGWLLPAAIVSLVFLQSRPYASLGYLAGFAVSLLLSGTSPDVGSSAVQALFWACMVISDPVTVTRKPLPGGIAGFACGVAFYFFSGSVAAMALCVLLLNALSFAAEYFLTDHAKPSGIKIAPLIPYTDNFTDFTDCGDIKGCTLPELSREDFINRVRQCGVFGFGGAAFPAADKIETVLNAQTPHKHLIVNGVECDPGLIHDKWLIRHRLEDIRAGISLLTQQIGFDTAVLAVKNMDGLAASPELYKVKDVYPTGAERLLIHEILGFDLPVGAVPAKEGILVLNVQTVLALLEAVCRNQKVDARYLTVANIKAGRSAVARVPLGANVRDVLRSVFPGEEPGVCFVGGGAMQCRYAGADTLVDKSINFIAVADAPYYKESPGCSHCGCCMAACPAGISVYKAAALLEKGKTPAVQYGIEKCLNCGACSYVCPAGRNLCARIQAAKTVL